MHDSFLSLLCCPLSRKPLSISDTTLVTSDGAHTYPLVQGIPWLMAHPRNSLLDWGAKLNQFQQTLLQEISTLEVALKDTSLIAGSPTFRRLQMLLTGKKAFLLQVTQLLQPLVQTQVASAELYNALLDTAPPTQNLLSYEANVYRDWVWGAEENALSLEIIQRVLPDNVGRLSVVGAGAGRLAWDIHQSCQPDLTVASDINPLFLLTLQHLLQGESLTLNEFPLLPKALEMTCVEHVIPGLNTETDNFYLAFSDASKPAFIAEAFDTVLTPWLIDIQPHALHTFLCQINHYLPIGGYWVNFGTLAFQQGRDALCYSEEEVQNIAQQAGFELELRTHDEVPYLKSPHNAGYRVEQVWAWRARKVREVTTAETMQVLPKWLLDTDLAIPKQDSFARLAVEQAFTADLLARVDGTVSIAALARKLAQQHHAAESEVRVMLIDYFSQLLIRA